MARLIAQLRLLGKLAGRELRGTASLGLNNLFFCVLFLMQGGRKQDAFWSTLLFQIVLLIPLLFSVSTEAMGRLPEERVLLWPITVGRRMVLGWVSLLFTPMFCVLGLVYFGWMGAAAAIVFGGLALVIHAAVLLRFQLGRRWRALPGRGLRVPRAPGRMGGVAQVTLGQVLGTLDFWTALLLSVVGAAYRWFAKAPQVEAFPMLAMLVALAMSTVAQRMMSLDGGEAFERYRLLPVRGWELLLAQDAAYLLLVGVLVLPLNLRAGMAFSLVALAVGRWPSLRRRNVQRRWRFTAGEVVFGGAQVVLGIGTALASVRASGWFVGAAGVVYFVSVLAGDRMWRRIA